GYLFVDFGITFSIFALLLLIVVPLGLKIAKKEPFKEYSQTIGLSKTKPVWRNTLLGLGILGIWGLSSLLFTFIFGEISFNHWYFENPSLYSTYIYGWFWFILNLIPGIWEEVTFRGIILNHQLKNSSQSTSVILNGVLFGLFHLVNLLFGANLLNTILQVFYASCLGISFAYIYTKTRSLLPCILGHYLFNTFGQIFTNGVFPNILNESLYKIFGIGIFPMIIAVLITYLIFRRRSLETQNL
ncbi:MAG: CPBP family intramembrane metalloprotease, partial [Promethearchaeota archaeon]